MVATPIKEKSLSVVEIPVEKIKVVNRLRSTAEGKIAELAESIKDINLLHPITVSETDGEYLLLSGHHRLKAVQLLGWSSIPATIHDDDDVIRKSVEIQENICRQELTAIQVADHIVLWEDLLTQLGKRAKSGQNRFNRTGLTNADLAARMGMDSRAYQRKKSIATMHPEVKDILNETPFAFNNGDMIALAKESDVVQLEVAQLLSTGKSSSFKRALGLARCKCLPFKWNEEQTRIKELIGQPKSVMKFSGTSSQLFQLCKVVREDEERSVSKHQFGTHSCKNYAQHPDHSAYFINYYSNEGDLLIDCMAGSGTNVLVGAALNRRVVAYDLSTKNLDSMRSACLEHTDIDPNDLTLHHSDGVEIIEYADQENIFDLATFDPPYVLNAESYGEDPRDLCNIKDPDEFYSKLETCMKNLSRLIKPSNWEKKEFHPIIIKVGSARRYGTLLDMSTDVEIIGRRLNLKLHDKVINVLDSYWTMWNASRSIDHKYSVKIHETNLIFTKY